MGEKIWSMSRVSVSSFLPSPALSLSLYLSPSLVPSLVLFPPPLLTVKITTVLEITWLVSFQRDIIKCEKLKRNWFSPLSSPSLSLFLTLCLLTFRSLVIIIFKSKNKGKENLLPSHLSSLPSFPHIFHRLSERRRGGIFLCCFGVCRQWGNLIFCWFAV